MYKLRGKVLNKRTEDINTKKGDFKKMLFEIEESETGFNHHYQFEIFGDESIVMFKDKIIEGKFINVEFYIKSNEWKGRYFNTLVPKHIHLEGGVVSDFVLRKANKKEIKNDLDF